MNACQESQGCPTFNVACSSGGRGVISAIYCISFIFGVNFVMLNLVIAVIIDQFVESAGREGLFLDNTLFEILHKKMLLDRFLKRLRTKVGLLTQVLASLRVLAALLAQCCVTNAHMQYRAKRCYSAKIGDLYCSAWYCIMPLHQTCAANTGLALTCQYLHAQFLSENIVPIQKRYCSKVACVLHIGQGCIASAGGAQHTGPCALLFNVFHNNHSDQRGS